MEYENLVSLLCNGKSLNDISKETGKSLTTIIYWTNKFDLKPNFKNFKQIGKKEYGETRFCPKCQKDCPTTDFFKRRGRLFSSTYCRGCTKSTTLERMINFKKICVEYKGGQCKLCGYNKYYGALEFHHVDPMLKRFNISQVKSYKFSDFVKEELDRCELLCSNCHREVESGVVVLPRIELGSGD